MRSFIVLLISFYFLLSYSQPIALHPDNPHYFLFRGKPTVLVGSTEHYGAVLNLDFDYNTYLRTVFNDGLKMTRTWSGVYRELNNSFGIFNNTLGPLPNRYIAPWARTNVCCYKDGGNKFDLNQWDPAYWARIKDFLTTADKYDIVVNLGLFCRFYWLELWEISPMNVINNVNNVGANQSFAHVYNLQTNKPLIPYMVNYTAKIVTELNDFDNLFYEVINEPDNGVTGDWTDLIISTIHQTELNLPKKHMISQNSLHMNPLTDIYSFHYGTYGDVVGNYHLNRALSDGETGFAGTADVAYRTQGWQWMIGGGATYDNLDYSWTVARPDGTACCPVNGPSGGGPLLRKQLSFLLSFMNSLDLVNMAPNNSVILSVFPTTAWVGALSHKNGLEYAIYINNTNSVTLKLNLPDAVSYTAAWFNTLNGQALKVETLFGGVQTVVSPTFTTDTTLYITRHAKK